MGDHPIIMSPPMVRALLEGRKTQTRRVVKPQPIEPDNLGDGEAIVDLSLDRVTDKPIRCPYGYPGELLWVREAWAQRPSGNAIYRADRPDEQGWRPSIHMPRWASRLTLKITDVALERLHDIDGYRLGAEGMDTPQHEPPDEDPRQVGYPPAGSLARHERDYMLREFTPLWDSLNAKRGFGWDKNPWVWAITFEVLRGNIDAYSN